MAIMGRMDQMLSPKGITMSVAPLGAVCAILFTTPSAPAARVILKHMLHIYSRNLIILVVERKRFFIFFRECKTQIHTKVNF